METLLLISGELLVFPVVAAAALLAELLMGLVLGFVQLVLGPLRRRRARRSGVALRVPGLGLLRRIRSWIASLAMGVLVTLLAADLFFFEAAVRYVLSGLDQVAALEVEFDEAHGSFLAGRVELSGLVVRRGVARGDAGGDDGGEGGSALDVRAERFEIDVAMLEVLASEKRVQTLVVEGLRGRVERGRAGDGKSGVRRRFRVDTLALSDVAVQFVDHTRERPVDVALAVEHLDVAPLRSEFALFDLLYGANGSGAIDGLSFEVTSARDDDGRTTTWRAPELPLALATPYLGAGGRFVEGGHVEVEVRDVWRTRQQPPEISMHYRLVLHDLKIALPEQLGVRERALALPLAAAVEKLGREIPLEFSIELDEERFRGAVSLEAIGLWQAASGALAQAMMAKTGLDGGQLSGLGKLGGALLGGGGEG